MHKFLAVGALLLAAPLAAQTPPQVDHAAHQGAMQKPAPAMSAMDHGKMEGMDHTKMGGKCEMMKNTAANPYAEAGMAMHHKMMVVGSDASETWVRQMIEHDRGAIAMSKIALTQAKDKDVRAMAQQDIAIQEKDIASLQSWLKQHGKKAQ